MSASRLDVYVVDDDDAVRNSLGLLLFSHDHVVRKFASGESFLEAIQPHSEGCVVLDVRMPGMTGLQVFEQLRQRASHLIVLFLSGHGDIPMAVQAIKEGAFDFLEKPCDDEALLDKVRNALIVAEGGLRHRREQASVAARRASLTAREWEVCERLLTGKSNKEIARDFVPELNFRTVETHRANVFAKMAVRNAMELARLLNAV